MNSGIEIYTHIDIWALIFCRIFFALVFLPVIVETKVPPQIKVGLSAILATIVFFTVDKIPLEYSGEVIGLMLLVVKESVIGLIIGFSILIFFQVYYFVGNLLSTQGGIGMSTLLDPVNGMQMPILGKFYYMGFCVLFILSGGYHWFISELIETFIHIPVGQGVLRPEIAYEVVEAIALFWEVSFKLASPIIAVIFIVDCGLGILARAVPQMNMFVIGIPLKMIILLVMLMVTTSLLPAFNNLIINHLTGTLFSIVRGLIP